MIRKLSSGRSAKPPRIRQPTEDDVHLGLPETPAQYYTSSADESETLAESSAPDSSPTVDLRNSTAPSEFRAYRHTLERDRDSAFARLLGEDAFELDYGLLGTPSDPGRSATTSPLLPPPVAGPSLSTPSSTFPVSPHVPHGAGPLATPVFASPLASTSRSTEPTSSGKPRRTRMVSVEDQQTSSVPVMCVPSDCGAIGSIIRADRVSRPMTRAQADISSAGSRQRLRPKQRLPRSSRRYPRRLSRPCFPSTDWASTAAARSLPTTLRRQCRPRRSPDPSLAIGSRRRRRRRAVTHTSVITATALRRTAPHRSLRVRGRPRSQPPRQSTARRRH